MSRLMITIQFYSLTDTDFIFTPSICVRRDASTL